LWRELSLVPRRALSMVQLMGSQRGYLRELTRVLNSARRLEINLAPQKVQLRYTVDHRLHDNISMLHQMYNVSMVENVQPNYNSVPIYHLQGNQDYRNRKLLDLWKEPSLVQKKETLRASLRGQMMD